jgi:penicillin-binding protein-related factor A (putative recombinase)
MKQAITDALSELSNFSEGEIQDMREKILKASEKEIENSILAYLNANSIFCWKQNSVGIYDTKKEIFRRPMGKYIMPGVSDILGIFKARLLAIEVKRPDTKNRLTLSQKHFLECVNANGGIGFVATSVEEVADYLAVCNVKTKES